MYLIADKNNKVLSFNGRALSFEDKQEALKVIPKHLKQSLKLVWKPNHDDDVILTPKEFDKLIKEKSA
jgi:hypothetical protein|tara:strand:+ start:372 stop:575 length:204 start_codon:yes stop_codon:yes gene_type:complete